MPHDQPRPQGAFPWLSRWGGKRPWHRRVRPSFWLVDYERKRPNKSNLWMTQMEMVENVSTPTKISKITYINQSKWRSDPPMPDPFPAPPRKPGQIGLGTRVPRDAFVLKMQRELSNEDMILALAGQFKQFSHEPEKFRFWFWFTRQ